MNPNLSTCIWCCPAFRMKQTKEAHIECISVIGQCSLIVCIVLWGLLDLKIFRTRVQYIGFEYELWTESIKNLYIVMWESFTSDFIMTFCWNANYLQNLCCNRQWEDIAFSSWGYWKIFVFYEIALILIIERLFRSIDDIITKYCHCYCHCHCHQILSLLYYHAFII